MQAFQTQSILTSNLARPWVLRAGYVFLAAIAVWALSGIVINLGLPNTGRLFVASELAVVLGLLGALLWTIQQLVQTKEQLRLIQISDAVTGLPNRAHFLQQTNRVIAQSGMLLVMDVDQLEALNRARGRCAGDRCLLALAQRFRSLTRPTDILGRLDGGGFAIYMPGAPIERAQDVGASISEGLQIMDGSTALRVTVSVGAIMADGCTSLEKLMVDADHALDLARMQGFARVVVRELPEAA